MKRVLLPVLLLLALTLTACQSAVPMGQDPYAFAALGRAKAPRTPDKTVAVWVSYLDYKPMLTGKTEQQFRDACEQMLDNMAPLSVNTVYFQVRPFSDSLYPSAFFPRSAFAPGSGSEFAFDPLAVLLELAGAKLDPACMLGTVGYARPAELVMVNGRVVVEHGRVLGMDEEQTRVRAQQLVDGMLQKAE